MGFHASGSCERLLFPARGRSSALSTQPTICLNRVSKQLHCMEWISCLSSTLSPSSPLNFFCQVLHIKDIFDILHEKAKNRIRARICWIGEVNLTNVGIIQNGDLNKEKETVVLLKVSWITKNICMLLICLLYMTSNDYPKTKWIMPMSFARSWEQPVQRSILLE